MRDPMFDVPTVAVAKQQVIDAQATLDAAKEAYLLAQATLESAQFRVARAQLAEDRASGISRIVRIR